MAKQHDKPLIALLMGDAAGIGPELALKALTNDALTSQCIFVVLGNKQVLAKTAETLDIEVNFVDVQSTAEARTVEQGVALLEHANLTRALISSGASRQRRTAPM